MLSKDTYEYDFAFSYASENREIVKSVKNKLEAKNYKVFYDENEQSELLGKDIYSTLKENYKSKSKFVICFLSQDYLKKMWTNFELNVIKERLLLTFFSSDFLIPVLLDNSPIPEDIPNFIGYCKYTNVEELVNHLDKKYSSSLKEDIYFSNMNNIISILSNKIEKVFQSNKILHSIKLNDNYYFKTLTTYDTQSIGFFKKNENYFNYIPEILITWDIQSGIEFKLYHFNDMKECENPLNTLDELARELSQYILKRKRW